MKDVTGHFLVGRDFSRDISNVVPDGALAPGAFENSSLMTRLSGTRAKCFTWN